MWDACFITWGGGGGVKVSTPSKHIRLERNGWNLWYPQVGAVAQSIKCVLHLAGPPRVTVCILGQQNAMVVRKAAVQRCIGAASL